MMNGRSGCPGMVKMLQERPMAFPALPSGAGGP